MASNFKRMDEIRAILKMYMTNKSIKATARMMRVSKNTVKRYLRQCMSKEVVLSEILNLNDAELQKVFYSDQTSHETIRQEKFYSKVDYWLSELNKKGVTRMLLWQEYKEEYPRGFSYTQFCVRLKNHVKRKDLTLALNHSPAEKLMIDFAGKKMSWFDPQSGEQYWAEVLVVVLPHSQYTFAIALPDQKTENFIHGINKALEYIGGVPEYILSDNLKAYVVKADRYEPNYNELAVQLGNHYGVHLQSTRARRPKDKASVENMVSTIYTRLYAPLRNRIFWSIDEINEAFIERLAVHNQTPFQKREGNRKLIFDQNEKDLLRPLPSEVFEVKKITRAKVQNNYHAFLGEEKNYYSVPHQYVGQQVEIVYTSQIVEIYLKGNRIAIHNRLGNKETYRYATQENHKPEAHRIYEELRQYNDTDFMEQASEIGENTHWAIDQILSYQPNKDQAYKSCLGILRLGKSKGYQRLEKASKKCKLIGHVNYKILNNILVKNLEEQPLNPIPPPKVMHDNIRGSKSYH